MLDALPPINLYSYSPENKQSGAVNLRNANSTSASPTRWTVTTPPGPSPEQFFSALGDELEANMTEEQAEQVCSKLDAIVERIDKARSKR